MLPSTFRTIALVACVFVCHVHSTTQAEASDVSRLARQLAPLVECLSGQRESYAISAEISAKIDDKIHPIDFRLVRYTDDSFDLKVAHQDYALELSRREDGTAMVLPRHKQVYLGKGETAAVDHLAPAGIARRLISTRSTPSTYLPMLEHTDSGAVALMLTTLTKLTYSDSNDAWNVEDSFSIKFSESGNIIDIRIDESRIRIEIAKSAPKLTPLGPWTDYTTTTLDRAELERQLARGVRRATEILAPGAQLTSPSEKPRRVAHGELRWIGGQRVALLHGSPEEIGQAHGQLLRDEALRCIDSVLYTFGTVETVRSGRWFRHDLDAAYARLESHIPERHKLETRALAASLQLDPALMESLNVFPELFHCSGFAVFDSATSDGTLYHGRVLDYMTTIGLQDSATTFIVSPNGMNGFANVGYAGFVGSVSGMNDQSVSLGEMGGRGEGQWDGVPMATLMRRALEECATLEEVKTLWSNSPRTCEYYYVFADGKTNQAVGVAATPEAIEFIGPGQAHDLLGHGIEDAVVLSAGSRLETLRERVINKHGKIDAETAMWLMSRPVAMESNLHNVLFIPEHGILHVANANHDAPAAERPYVELNLHELLQDLSKRQLAAQTPIASANDAL